MTVVSVAVVAPDNGLDGDRVRGFEPYVEEAEVEFEVLLLSPRVP